MLDCRETSQRESTDSGPQVAASGGSGRHMNKLSWSDVREIFKRVYFSPFIYLLEKFRLFLGLCSCTWAFLVVAYGPWDPEFVGSVAVAHELSCYAACGSLVPDQDRTRAPALEGDLTTGLIGKSLRGNLWLCGSASISNF